MKGRGLPLLVGPGECWGCHTRHDVGGPAVSEYDGKQFVGIDLHRRHSVIVRQTSTGERLSAVRIVNDPDSLALQLEEAGEHPEVERRIITPARRGHRLSGGEEPPCATLPATSSPDR
jgi:hypothetical protein